MNTPHWEQLQAAFLELADADADVQRLVLERWRVEDASLATALERMLTADESGDTLLDRPLAARAADLLAPTTPDAEVRCGPYRLEEAIGEGGMGVVYRARRDDVDATAAIKVLRDAWLSPARRDRFREEQRTLASLDHPAIARLLDADHLDDGTPWFAMEYVEGMPITSWCWSRTLPVRARLALVMATLEAVRHAHERAVIHRDLKPSNLLVTEDGRVKLLDFGIAKRTVAGAVVDATRTGLRLLTPAYAAPEQLAGETVGVQADVYAIGVLLFELLAGARPYDVSELSTAEAVRRLRDTPAPRLSLAVRRATIEARAGAVPVAALSRAEWADLDAIVAGALDPELSRRYRSAEALLRDLQRFASSQPLEMRPATWRYRTRLFLRRRRTEALFGAFAVVVLAIGSVAWTQSITHARDEARTQAARTERLQRFLVRLFEGGDDDAGPSDTLRVATLIDNGVREARLLTDDPDAQLDLFQSLGTIAQQLGRYALADSLLEDAVRGRTQRYGPAHEETLHARTLAAGLRVVQQDYDAARDAFREVLAVAQRTLPATHRVTRDASQGLGTVYTEFGELDSARVLLEHAVRGHAADGEGSLAHGDALTLLANVHYYAGRYDESDALNQQALEIARTHLGDEHPSLAYNLVNLGSAAVERGKFEEAEPHYLRAIALFERWYGPEHPRSAPVLRMLAQLRITQGRPAEAVPLLERAVRTFEASVDTLSPSLANLYATMAQLRSSLGDGDDAVRLHTRARDIARVALGTSHTHYRMHTGNLAAELTLLGRLDEAAALLVPMLRDARVALPPDDVNLAFWTARLARVRAGQRRWTDGDSLYDLALEGMRASGYADTATLHKLEREHAAVRDSLARAVRLRP
jgi:eukaryotic-like serine/threonine-protein kinase